MVAMAAYAVTLFAAAADGIQPAALLSFGDKGPQVRCAVK